MNHLDVLYYLLQFYLFATCGALSYLSLRAWLDTDLYRRKREDPYRVPRWTHLVRALAISAVAVAAIVGALKEGAVGISLSGLSWIPLLRVAGYCFFLGFLPRVLRREKRVWSAAALIIVGEVCLLGRSGPDRLGIHSTVTLFNTLPFLGLLLSDVGIGIIGIRVAQSIVRVRLVDRLVIAFAIFSLFVAQVVAVLTVGILSSFEDGVAAILTTTEKPLLMTLTAVLPASVLIGYFLARDLTDPVTRLGRTLREIGEGNLNQRIDLGKSRSGDEMTDLAVEVNRMAAQLKAAEELRSDFFSFVSHELRSPLTSIQGFITTLESVDDFSADERCEMYGIIHGETDRLLRMINELLDVSRIQSGKPLKLNTEWFDLNRHLSKIAGITENSAPKHKIDLVLPENPVWINADPDKVDQIVINLMSNAVKYAPSGGTITLKLIHSDTIAKVSVADQGVGMTSDQCDHVFEKFYRVAEQEGDSAKRLRRVEGSGIGLYLTKALVEAHNGSISVMSEPGTGSIFTVSLPKHTAGLGEAREGASQPIKRSQVRPSLLDETDRVHVPHLLEPASVGAQSRPVDIEITLR